MDKFLLITGGSAMVLSLLSTLIFTRISMKTIERKMIADGIDVPWWDQKGWGFRVSTFVTVLARSKPSKYPVLADEVILRHSRIFDRVLARVVSISFVYCMICGTIHYFIYNT
ncbi:MULTISPECIES: hypothetical protein [unclassified Shewanella]|uniref:hypothetical protein n=1 Tax=unclassified Shewanella TaxID=196818 RepID=UPI0035526874